MKTRILASLSLATALIALPAAAPMAQQATVSPAYLEMRDVAHGEVQELNYQSESLNKDREALVYLPPGYDASTDRYPVLYLLHGAGGDERVAIFLRYVVVITLEAAMRDAVGVGELVKLLE